MPLSFRSFLNYYRSRDLLVPDKPIRERHLISALCSVMSIVCIIAGLSMQQWAVSGSSMCDCTYGLTEVHCMASMTTSNSKPGCSDFSMTNYYHTSHEILISCILSISVLTMMSSTVATAISGGFPREKLEFLRHYSVFNIVSLLCIILVAGFWLAVINSLPLGTENDAYNDTVRFGYGFYIFLCSGVFTLIATCLNLLLAKTAAERRREYRNRFRNRMMRSSNSTNARRGQSSPLPPPTPPPPPTTNESDNTTTTENPPEYTETTTSFIEDVPLDSSDTDPLVPQLPPYVP